MVGGFDGDEDGDRQSDLVGVQDSDAAQDDAVLLHPPDALPARSWGQSDLGGDICQGERGIE